MTKALELTKSELPKVKKEKGNESLEVISFYIHYGLA